MFEQDVQVETYLNSDNTIREVEIFFRVSMYTNNNITSFNLTLYAPMQSNASQLIDFCSIICYDFIRDTTLSSHDISLN